MSRNATRPMPRDEAAYMSGTRLLSLTVAIIRCYRENPLDLRWNNTERIFSDNATSSSIMIVAISPQPTDCVICRVMLLGGRIVNLRSSRKAKVI
jgi:hypothetical protein